MNHCSKVITRLVLLLVGSTGTLSAGSGYELHGEKRFENSIDVRVCRQLYVGGRAVAWVFGITNTSVGPVARICQEVSMLPGEVVTRGSTYGGTRDGWYVFNVVDGRATQLSLPELNEFSNSTWCGGLGAYWGRDGDGNYSLVLVDLNSGKLVARALVGPLQLETDDEWHLASATWSKDCEAATFADKRYLKKTTTLTRAN
jgi:hypothetical protein